MGIQNSLIDLENSWTVSLELDLYLPYDQQPIIIYPTKIKKMFTQNIYMNVYDFVHNHQKVERTEEFFNWWVVTKEWLIHTIIQQ